MSINMLEAALSHAGRLEEELAATKQKLEFAEAIIAGNNVLLSENVSAQLHIKELREALEDSISVLLSVDGDGYDQAHCQADDNRKALAKQPDTRVLDKALLEAEIAGWFSSDDNKLAELYAKLAELNKV